MIYDEAKQARLTKKCAFAHSSFQLLTAKKNSVREKAARPLVDKHFVKQSTVFLCNAVILSCVFKLEKAKN